MIVFFYYISTATTFLKTQCSHTCYKANYWMLRESADCELYKTYVQKWTCLEWIYEVKLFKQTSQWLYAWNGNTSTKHSTLFIRNFCSYTRITHAAFSTVGIWWSYTYSCVNLWNIMWYFMRTVSNLNTWNVLQKWFRFA